MQHRHLEILPGLLSMNKSKEITTLGGGCFWCLEAVFSELHGVENVFSGYSGGSVPDPSYQQICNGTTGHAEVVQITDFLRERNLRWLPFPRCSAVC
jgi:hypothetical protein